MARVLVRWEPNMQVSRAGSIDLAVVIAVYTERRLASIRAALQSLRTQRVSPRAVVVAVDNNPVLAERLSAEYDWITLVRNDGQRGASATRNRGVQSVATRFTAFLDDDETAHPDWLRELTGPFADPGVIGTGGRYIPSWHTPKPDWFPDEFAWVVGGSYLGLPTDVTRVRNVWSGNMAVRTEAFREVGGFRTDFGKRGAIPQPEDTDLCIRMSLESGGHWMYVPDAVILHDVPADRASLGFFLRRCYAEGAGKAVMERHLAHAAATQNEHDYTRTMLKASMQRLRGRHRAENWQGLAMLAGLASAGAGYARGLLGSSAGQGAGA
jgi:GT2 family glycosyltransferase